MLRFSSVILLAWVVSACSDSVTSELEGRWFGDSIENVDVAHLPSATGWVKGTSFEFTNSEVSITIPAQLPRSGPYQVLRADGRDLTIQIQRRDGTLDLARFTIDGRDALRWHLSEGRAVVLRRAPD